MDCLFTKQIIDLQNVHTAFNCRCEIEEQFGGVSIIVGLRDEFTIIINNSTQLSRCDRRALSISPVRMATVSVNEPP